MRRNWPNPAATQTQLGPADAKQRRVSPATSDPALRHASYFDRDRYGRYLAKCTVGGRDLGEAMVQDGRAVDLNGRYVDAESAARAARRGIWRGSFLHPAVWRRRNPRSQD